MPKIKQTKDVTFNPAEEVEKEEVADEATEIGKYKLQIQLWSIDANNQGRVTIPPIEFEVLEPIFEDDDKNVATVSCLRDDE